MQAPLLFGVDPDETWRYVPAVVRDAGFTVPAFILKAPRLALATKFDEVDARYIARLNELAPGAAATLIETEREEIASPERKSAAMAWRAACATADNELAAEINEASEAVLVDSVAGWDGLTNAIGTKQLDFEALKGRLLEVIRDKALRAELVRAARAGASLSKDDSEGLPSSQALPAA